jgi:hypothetical protein
MKNRITKDEYKLIMEFVFYKLKILLPDIYDQLKWLNLRSKTDLKEANSILKKNKISFEYIVNFITVKDNIHFKKDKKFRSGIDLKLYQNGKEIKEIYND